MGCIHGLISKHPIDREVFLRGEPSLLVGQFIQHLCRYSGGVGAEEVFHRLFSFEYTPIADGSETT